MSFESGKVYKLAAFRTGSALTLKSSTGLVVGDMFEGKPNQLWKAETTPSGFWSFKNVERQGLYLGIERKIVATDGKVVSGVSYPFAWAPKRVGEDSSTAMFKLFIPYTNQVLDLNHHGGWANGILLQVYKDRGAHQVTQKWIIDSNTTFEHPVNAGGIYKIVNCHSGTVVQIEDTRKVAGYSFNDGRNQKWEAIPDESTGYWYFRNPWSGLYIALTSDSDPVAQDSARAVGVPHPFAWDVVPERAHGAQGEACRIFVPYTALNLDLDLGKADPGTIIKLSSRDEASKQRWRFELLGVAQRRPSGDGNNVNANDVPA